ncbi:Sodium/hydrogen exchanger family-domain-containing protein [Kockovaella imperatae]|uniref:Sodium/hydrogen exchanger family-domain-containing protein n=1 Tax=Kockovaella imperatae TaxID=4999 RepID=A0A1Y1UEQ9_9TREE|nr:Sodium/hydrogen exchanger family-domain-containing protein [Kockovaella imperatae]ORX36017.1 Sodium/hydrogen exchanger family-domain-containing protein [Kockovaella imperatae]
MVALDITKTSLALAVSGGYVIVIGLVSFFLKEKLFIAETLLSTLAGIIFGPISLGWFNPNSWSADPSYLTLQVARIIIAIQVLFTGISLPKAYLRKNWISLTTLLGPIMTTAWFITSLLVWAMIPGLTFLEALVIGACVTPTDPVLANAICKGRFAEMHVPVHVREIIVAEAGANDGLGYPFLYIPLYLILIHERSHPWHTVGGAVLEWFYNIVLYEIVLSCIIGAIIGYVARKVLRFSEERHLIDHESFLAFGIALTFFTLGVVGILGSDDILCCFVVGNSFTWDDWFRVETEDHAFQDVIDQLLNSAIFLYIGAILPWAQFSEFNLTPWRLVVLGILVMICRRLPWVLALSHFIPTLPTWRESLFAGFFGPIGVGALFYTQVALEELPDDGTRQHLRNVLYPVNLFLIFTSIVVHGITIPVGKGFQRARTITRNTGSRAPSTNEVSRLPPPVPLGGIRSQPVTPPRSGTPMSTRTPTMTPGPSMVRFGTLDGRASSEVGRGDEPESAH